MRSIRPDCCRASTPTITLSDDRHLSSVEPAPKLEVGYLAYKASASPSMLHGQSVLGAGSVNRTPEGRLRNDRFATSLSQHEEQMLRSAGNQSTGSSPMSYQSDLAAGTRVRGDGQRLVLWQRCTCLGDFVRDFSLPGGRGRARCRLVFAPLGAIDHGFHARKRPRPLIERRGGCLYAIMPEHWWVRVG